MDSTLYDNKTKKKLLKLKLLLTLTILLGSSSLALKKYNDKHNIFNKSLVNNELDNYEDNENNIEYNLQKISDREYTVKKTVTYLYEAIYNSDGSVTYAHPFDGNSAEEVKVSYEYYIVINSDDVLEVFLKEYNNGVYRLVKVDEKTYNEINNIIIKQSSLTLKY